MSQFLLLFFFFVYPSINMSLFSLILSIFISYFIPLTPFIYLLFCDVPSTVTFFFLFLPSSSLSSSCLPFCEWLSALLLGIRTTRQLTAAVRSIHCILHLVSLHKSNDRIKKTKNHKGGRKRCWKRFMS